MNTLETVPEPRDDMATQGIRDGEDVSKLFIFDTRLGPTEETEHEKVRARVRGCADARPAMQCRVRTYLLHDVMAL